MPSPLRDAVVPNTYVHLLYEHLQAQGRDAEALLGEAPPPSQGRFPVLRWRQQLRRAASALNDPLLGLHLGQRITPRHFGVLGHVLLSCGNLAGALARLERYQRLIYDVNPMRVELRDAKVILSWSAERGRPGSLVDETAIAALMQFCRDITGLHDACADSIAFINPAPAALGPYEQWFGCPVQFRCDRTEVIFHQQLLEAPLRQADAALSADLDKQAASLLGQLERGEEAPLSAHIRQMIAARLRYQTASAEHCATALHTSPRHLHRRLATEGSRFRELLAQTRQQLAEHYLHDPGLQLEEIAALLGYAEHSAFSRAFKHWTGESPRQFRERLENAPS